MPDLLSNLAMGFGVALWRRQEHRALLPVRLRDRDRDRGPARHRAAHRDGADPAGDLLAARRWARVVECCRACCCRRAVRPGVRPPRSLVKNPRRDRVGVITDAGRPRAWRRRRPRRAGARHRGARLAVRRLVVTLLIAVGGAAARQDRAAVCSRPTMSRVMIARARVRRRAGARLGAQGRRHDRARRACSASSAPMSTGEFPADHGDSTISSTASASCRCRWACSASPRSWSILEAATFRRVSGQAGERPAGRRAHGPAGGRCPRMVRGTAIGAAFGILPGGGPTIAAFSAYSLEKKVSRRRRSGSAKARSRAWRRRNRPTTRRRRRAPSRCSASAFPPNALMALMIGAMMVPRHRRPGPTIITKQPALFWGVDRATCGSAT